MAEMGERKLSSPRRERQRDRWRLFREGLPHRRAWTRCLLSLTREPGLGKNVSHRPGNQIPSALRLPRPRGRQRVRRRDHPARAGSAGGRRGGVLDVRRQPGRRGGRRREPWRGPVGVPVGLPLGSVRHGRRGRRLRRSQSPGGTILRRDQRATRIEWEEAVAEVRQGRVEADWLPKKDAGSSLGVEVVLLEHPTPSENALDEAEIAA